MKIQFLVQSGSGISLHRLITPFSCLDKGEDNIEMLWIGRDEGNISCDILVYNKFLLNDTDKIRKLQSAGTKIVVDVDDYWHLPGSHINYDSWIKNGTGQKIEDNIRLADIVICTSMRLQEEIRKINKNTVVIPNAFPFGERNYQPLEPQRKSEKMTFLYAGGSTHLPDVKLLEGKFKRIATDPSIREKALFVLAGYDTGKKITRTETGALLEEQRRGVWDFMASIFRNTGSYEIWPTAHVLDYINYYDNCDVVLIPLQDTHWNSCKSILKILEAAAKKKMVICSKVAPYTELEGYPGILWVENNNWLEHIRHCIKNPEWVKEQGELLAERIWEDYHLEKWNQVRRCIFNSLIKEVV